MRLVFECVLTVIIGGVLLAAVHAVRTAAVTPVPKTDGAKVISLLAVKGPAPQLEQTVNALIWLNKSGKFSAEIVIADCGLTPPARKVAELLAKDNGAVALCHPDRISSEVCQWSKTNSSE